MGKELTQQDLVERIGGGTVARPTAFPATTKDIAGIEKRLGVKFPADYKRFLQTWGSLWISVDASIWPRPEIGAIGPHWQMVGYDLYVYGVCKEAPWMAIEAETQDFRAQHEAVRALTPVIGLPHTSDRYCFDPSGTMVRWIDGELSPANETFLDCVLARIAEQRGFKEELLGQPRVAARKPTRSSSRKSSQPQPSSRKPPSPSPTRRSTKQPPSPKQRSAKPSASPKQASPKQPSPKRPSAKRPSPKRTSSTPPSRRS